MANDYHLYLQDIHDSAEKVMRYTRGYDFEQFMRDEKTVDGVVHNLEIIGEAAAHVPPDVQAQHPEAGWQRLAELRALILEDHHNADPAVVWDVVQNQVPPLLRQVRAIFEREGTQEEHRGRVDALGAVDSAMLYAIGYDEATQTLETIFYSGGIYRYHGVPRDVYEGLLQAPSKGRYMWAHVIDHYPYEPVRRRSR